MTGAWLSMAVERRIVGSPAKPALNAELPHLLPLCNGFACRLEPVGLGGETAKSLTPLTFCCSGDLFWLGWWSLRCCQPGIIDTVCPEVKANGAGFMQGCSAQVEKASWDYYQMLELIWTDCSFTSAMEPIQHQHKPQAPMEATINQSINQSINSIAKCKLAALRKIQNCKM